MEVPKDLPARYIYILGNNETVIFYRNIIYKQAKWFICVECKRLSQQNMNIKKFTPNPANFTDTCIHCFFTKIYKDGNMDKFDNNPISFGEYIKLFKNKHDANKCLNGDNCILCLFKKDKLKLNISEIKHIFSGNILPVIDKMKINIVI